MEKRFFFYFLFLLILVHSLRKGTANHSDSLSLLGDSIVVLTMKFISHKEPNISTVGHLGTKVVYMKL